MDVIVALVALTAMEIVLGIDNIVFIAILAGRLPPAQQPRARTLGLVAALGTRIILLLFLKQILGLTAPLFAAGARSIVATQWRIGDESTVRLVDDFYGALAQGLPVADALRRAKLAAIARGAPPAEWAGFTVVGDPIARAALALPASRGSPVRLGASGLVLLVVLVIYLRRRGRSSDRRDAGDTSAVTHH